MAKKWITAFEVGEKPRSLETHPDGRTFLVAYDEGFDVCIVATGEKVWGSRFENGIAGAAFAEGGRSVVVAAGRPRDPFRPLDVPSRERDLFRVTEEDGRRPLDVAADAILGAAPDGTFALLHYGDGELGLLDLATLTAPAPFVMAERAMPPMSIQGSLSRDGKVVVTATRRGNPAPLVAMLEVWTTSPEARRVRNSMVQVSSGDLRPAFTISPNGRYVFYGMQRHVVLWNVEQGNVETHGSAPAFPSEVNATAFSADGRRLLWLASDQACINDRLSRKKTATFDHRDPTMRLRCAAFTPEGDRFLAAAVDGRAFLWQLG